MPNNKKNNKQENIKFTDADKKKIKDEIIREVEDDIKDDLVKKVSDDVFRIYTISEKEKIKNQLTEEIKEDVKKRVIKDEALLSRKKSLKIFRLSVYILALLACIGYGIYRLYKTDNLMILNKDYQVTTTQTSNASTTESTTKRVKTLDELKNTYSYLMDKIYVDDINILLGSKTVSELNQSERLVIAYNSLMTSDINRDGKVFNVLNATLQSSFENIFGSNATYSVSDFSVNGISYTYLNSQDRFFAIGENYDNTRFIQSEIIDIKEEEEYVIIKEVVGFAKENQLYALNDLDNPIVTGYSSSVMDYKDSLTTVEYTFNKVDGSYKLFKISAK